MQRWPGRGWAGARSRYRVEKLLGGPGCRWAVMSSQRRLWIPSQPKLGKLGAGGVCLREGRGRAEEGASCVQMKRVCQKQGGGLGPLLESRASPRLEGDFAESHSEAGLAGPAGAPGVSGILVLPSPHTCIPPTPTWMEPWLLLNPGCQLKLLS